MSKSLFPILALLFAGLHLPAQTINWATDVAPILYEHCVKCHRDGGIGGFSLIGYGNAFSYRYSIANATGTKQMPPWKADPDYRHFAGENILSDGQIQKIQSWVDNGAPAGDLAQAPADPVFTPGSDVGQPDQVLQTPVYTLTSFNDEYRCFVVPAGLQQDAFLRGLEVLPGNHMAVHHVLVFEDTTGQARQLDDQTPEPGYVQFGGIGVNNARLVGAWVPGAQTRLMPPFMGVKLHAGADLVFQVHFPGNAVGLTEMTTVNLFYTPTDQGIREISIAPLLNHGPVSLDGYPLHIPANTEKTYHAKFTVPITASLIAVAPHMHLLGKSVECFGVTLLGDTIPLIRIPEWDFHWQGPYTFQTVQRIPYGTRLHAWVTYDNTANNPNNPSSPPQPVSVGEATTDEMLLVYFTYMQYQAGDEQIVLDSTLLNTAQHQAIAPQVAGLLLSPNPAGEQASLEFDLLETTDVLAEILDLQGRTLKVFAMYRQLPPGRYRESVGLSDLPPGQYVVRLQTSGGPPATAKLLRQ